MYLSQIRRMARGYSVEKFNELFGSENDYSAYLLKGSGLVPSYQFDKVNKKRTQDVIGQYADVYFSGAGVQRVKFPKNFTFDTLEDLNAIKLVSPEACEVNGQVYVKAEGLKEAND